MSLKAAFCLLLCIVILSLGVWLRKPDLSFVAISLAMILFAFLVGVAEGQDQAKSGAQDAPKEKVQ